MPAGQSRAFQTDPRTELNGLVHAVIPMDSDSAPRIFAKLVAGGLVGVWLFITVALTVDSVAATAPPYWEFFTAIVFLIVGKLWDLEVQKILPSGGNDNE